MPFLQRYWTKLSFLHLPQRPVIADFSPGYYKLLFLWFWLEYETERKIGRIIYFSRFKFCLLSGYRQISKLFFVIPVSFALSSWHNTQQFQRQYETNTRHLSCLLKEKRLLKNWVIADAVKYLIESQIIKYNSGLPTKII